MAMSDKVAAAAKLPARGVIEIPDSGPGAVAGLVLRVTANGAKAWSLRYSIHNQRRRITLGGLDVLGHKLARDRALIAKGKAAQGIDPGAAHGDEALSVLWPRHASARALVLRRPEGDDAIWRNHLEPTLGHLKPGKVGTAVLTDLFDDVLIRKGLGANARRSAHRVASRFFGWLVAKEIIATSPMERIGMPDRVVRSRVPTMAELRAIWAWAGSAGTGGEAIRLVLLTCLRRDEALGLRWEEVVDLDGEEPRLVIPAGRMKAGREHVVPLSPAAVALIRRRLPCRNWSGFVFPARRRRDGQPHVDRMSGANLSEMLRRAAVAPGVVVHDLRKAVTHLQKAGVPPHVVRFILSHSPASIVGDATSVYAKDDYLPERRAALALLADMLLSVPAVAPAIAIAAE